MWAHPFIESNKRRVQTVLFVLLLMLSYGAMLYLYGNLSLLQAGTDSVVSILLLVVSGYFFWFVVDIIHSPFIDFVLSVLMLLAWGVALFFLDSFSAALFGPPSHPAFVYTLLLRLVVAALSWMLMLLWYRNVKLQRWKSERLLDDVVQAPLNKIVDRIAVKSGTHIHVIAVSELCYVQACGDYVMLFSPNGEFLKEQTMKSLEAHLPANFVRVHRSYIVNVEQIQRVELMGKESYVIYLHSGASLRASAAGYKLLKEHLDLN